MILRELLKLTDFDVIADKYRKTYPFVKRKKKELKSILKSMVEELINLPSEDTDVNSIIVVKCKDYEENKFTFYYDTFCLCNESDSHYSYADRDWAKMINVEVYDKSINEYGIQNVIVAILYELSWHGYDYITAKKNQEDFWHKLEECNKEVEETLESGDLSELKTSEDSDELEGWKDFKINEKELAEIRKKEEVCHKYNNKEYKKLMG